MHGKIEKNITVDELISIIKDNPEKEKIELLRKLKAKKLDYENLKTSLPVFVPNALFKNKLGEENFFCGTGYIYLDIDDRNIDAHELKKKFTQRHPDKIFLCALSCSLGGIMILVKLNKVIDDFNHFYAVYNYLKTEVFSDFTFDGKVTNAGRINYISYDKDVFVNKDSCIDISGIDLDKYCKEKHESKNTVNTPINKDKWIIGHATVFYDLATIQNQLLFRTPVYFEKDELVKYQPIDDYVEVGVYETISDGKKRDTFSIVINGLKYLNPDQEKEKYIISYVYYLNNNKCNPRMEQREIKRLIEFTFSQINKQGCSYPFKTKSIHTNKSLKHTSERRAKISMELNGFIKVNDSIQRINKAKEELLFEGKKVNKRQVTLKGIADKTVLKHWDSELHDVSNYIEQINQHYKDNKSEYNNEYYIAPVNSNYIYASS